jgi:predicted nucleic acid-binding protein
MPLPHAPPAAVIDTQSVLDWLYFHNPACAQWEVTRQAGQWRWVASLALRHELALVLGRGQIGARWPGDATQVLRHFDQHASLCPQPDTAPRHWPRCTDREDQKFIDLALSHQARWLVSRDKAVLKLSRKCWAVGQVEIVRPNDWRAPCAEESNTA